MMKLAQHIFYGLFLLILIGVGAIFFAPSIPGLPAVEMKIVQSGSMEPGIKTGGVVLLAPATTYQVGDVITYTDTTASIPTTHRIVDSYVERGQTWFVTKGDANESIDASPVAASAVLGKVSFTVPFVGFVLDFARQPMGFALLIVLPALLIILGEVDKIVREIRGRRQPARSCPFVPTFQGVQVVRIWYRRQTVRMMDIGVPARFSTRHTLDLRNCLPRSREAFTEARQRWFPDWAMALVLIGSSSMFAVASFVPYTASYFSDSVVSAGNVFRAGFFAVEPPEPFAFSVTPINFCQNYTPVVSTGNLNVTVDYNFFPNVTETLNYQVSIQSAVGDICDRLSVKADNGNPVALNLFSFTTSGAISLTFNNISAFNQNNSNSCTLSVLFSGTTASGAVYATTSLVTIQRNNVACPATTQTLQSATVEVEPRPLSTAGMSTALEPVDEEAPAVETEPVQETEEEGIEEEEAVEVEPRPLSTADELVENELVEEGVEENEEEEIEEAEEETEEVLNVEEVEEEIVV
jgi:signal peptidase I